jgi:hypothetical protein
MQGGEGERNGGGLRSGGGWGGEGRKEGRGEARYSSTSLKYKNSKDTPCVCMCMLLTMSNYSNHVARSQENWNKIYSTKEKKI